MNVPTIRYIIETKEKELKELTGKYYLDLRNECIAPLSIDILSEYSKDKTVFESYEYKAIPVTFPQLVFGFARESHFLILLEQPLYFIEGPNPEFSRYDVSDVIPVLKSFRKFIEVRQDYLPHRDIAKKTSLAFMNTLIDLLEDYKEDGIIKIQSSYYEI